MSTQAQQPVTPENFAAQMQDLIGQLRGGQNVAAAGNPGAGENVAAKSVTAAEQREAMVDPLRACFENLALAHKGYSPLTSNALADNPYRVLRSKSQTPIGERYDVSDAKLGGMIATLLQKGAGRSGVPLGQWMNQSGRGNAIETALEGAISQKAFGEHTQIVERALSAGAGTGGVMIRTDIEPLMREGYLRSFPVADVIPSIPANGLVHTYNVKTGTGAAALVSELGDLTGADADSTFERKANSNVAVLASRRAISLKLQFASQQSGMAFGLSGPDNTEVKSAFTAIAKLNQQLLLQGNQTVSSGAGAATENGAYNANGYDGLRLLLKAAGTSLTKSSETYLQILNRAVAQIANAGGDVNNLIGFMSYGARLAVNNEFQAVMRVLEKAPQGGFASNLSANGFVSVADFLTRLMNVPSSDTNGIGTYQISAVDLEDIYLADPEGMALAYLGSPNPVVLELPVGFNNALSNVYIVFLMNGLVLYIPSFARKIRIPLQTV